LGSVPIAYKAGLVPALSFSEAGSFGGPALSFSEAGSFGGPALSFSEAGSFGGPAFPIAVTR
jgi:hypothetical protein